MSTDEDMNARLCAAGERFRSANKTIADIDLGYLEIPAETVDVPVTPAGQSNGRQKRGQRMRGLIAAGAGIAAAVTATLIAVSLKDSPAKTHPAVSGIGANGLVGVDWRLVKVVGLATTPAVLDARARLMIDSLGQLTGTDGCNSLGSHVTLTPDTINLGAVVKTEMACVGSSKDFAARTARVDAVLAGSLQWSVKGNELTLSQNGKAVLVYRAAPPPTTDPAALTAHEWQLDGIMKGSPDGSTSTSSLPPGAKLVFDGKGRFTASDGCNGGGGQVTITPGRLEINEYASEQKACPHLDQALLDTFAKTLTGTVSWSVKDGQLTLTKAGVGSLSYHQPANSPSSPSTGSS